MIFLLAIVVPVFIGVMLGIAPLVRRRVFMFSVRVAANWPDSVEARRIVKLYRLQVAFWTLVAAGLSYRGLSGGGINWLVVGPLLQVFGALLAIGLARRATLPFASRQPSGPQATQTDGGETSPMAGNVIHAVVPMSMLCCTAIWLWQHWALIPERFPVHWNLAGQPNGWSTRTPLDVMQPLIIGMCTTLLVLVLSFAMQHGAVQPGGMPSMRRQTVRMMRGLGYLMSGLFCVIALGPLYPGMLSPAWLVPIVLASTTLLVIPVIRAANDPDSPAGGQTPDAAWKFGLFYYNPADPALMVEKRMGIGYTMNFGNRLAWVLMGVILLPPLGFVVVRLLASR